MIICNCTQLLVPLTFIAALLGGCAGTTPTAKDSAPGEASRQLRQVETRPDGRPSPVERPSRLVPVIVELSAPGNPYKAESPILLTITLRNQSSATISFVGWGIAPTDWNAETANIDLTDIYATKSPLNLYRARPETVPPHTLSGQSGRQIPPGGELSIAFDARKWTIEGGWRPGVYRVRANLRGLMLDDYTRAMIASDEIVLEIDKPR